MKEVEEGCTAAVIMALVMLGIVGILFTIIAFFTEMPSGANSTPPMVTLVSFVATLVLFGLAGVIEYTCIDHNKSDAPFRAAPHSPSWEQREQEKEADAERAASFQRSMDDTAASRLLNDGVETWFMSWNTHRDSRQHRKQADKEWEQKLKGFYEK